ncbi:hypothetical protein [Halalkalicoccus jeotgali]|uniref:Uncharacterized protein n=1 Tax=Halalkalicoccus jeotgali (strain DSM 18796 / CECT 7217 / JCM 14584 / KCTC 4019 / B3) TaxID=795797 RepID=D8J7M5_HALJB|nr:hypothetical protein [Halalkalicoccus jeotgali]ADJ16045.1 hypothetical protein HacjB3_13320 [Halalkalicoccus jeotgali B3]ELY38141.1 hypothetical protein C497_08524 [Halalkalicoccus jeotgali B3]
MALKTYTLHVEESETEDGLDVDVYDADGTIEASTWIGYEDYGVTSRGGDPEPTETTFSADVLTLDLQVERDEAAFLIRVLGDAEILASKRLVDEAWGLAAR